MSAADILKILGTHDGIYYRAYSPKDIVISLGIPPENLGAWDFVWARYNKPQVKRFPNLGGRGTFVNNKDKSGIIEIGVAQSSVDCGMMDVLEALGIAIPITVIDAGTAGTSGVLATSCRRVETPEWRRDAMPGIIPFTFEATFMTISWGVQLPGGEI
jgi:hypothetical protein